MKFRKIKKDFWNLERHLHHLYQIFLQIKLLEQSIIIEIVNNTLYTANSFTGNFQETFYSNYLFSNPLFCVC